MASVTSDFVRALNASVIGIYDEAFAGASGLWRLLATLIPSVQQSENYSWISEVPIMREFLDERQVRALRDYGFTITNRKWEATIGIARDVLEDDQTGQVGIRVRLLARAAAAHLDKLLFDLINANPTAYDGVAFYHATHGNLGTAAFSADALEAAIAAMMDQTTPIEGEPMDVRPNVLLVPPQLHFDAKRVLNSQYWPDATGAGAHSTNALIGEDITIVTSSRLATNTEWHLFDCRQPVKPWLIQQRIPPTLSTPNPDDYEGESAFLRDILLYGVRSRDNAGPGLWQYGYKSTGVG
jgi:phage major head subunit gpT-like protein